MTKLDGIDPREQRPHGYKSPSRYDIPGTDVQCIDLINALHANFHVGNIIKYVVRYCNLGNVEDLQKLRHYAEFELARVEACRRQDE